MVHSSSLQFTHWKKKHNMPKLLRSCKGPPRNQSPCEYSTLDLTGIPSELRTVQKCAVLECKSWSEAFPPQHTATPKPTIQTKKVSLDFRTLKSYCTLTIIDLWSASFPPRKHEMGKRPHPFQDLTLDGNGRPTWLAYLGSTNLKGANLWCRQRNSGRRVFDAFLHLPIDVYIGKLETNTWLITRNLIDNLRYSQSYWAVPLVGTMIPQIVAWLPLEVCTAGVKKIWSAFLHWSILELQKAAAINKAASEK